MGKRKPNTKKERAAESARRKKASRLSIDNRVAMLTITVIVGVLFTVLAVKGWHLHQEILANDDQKTALTNQISDEEARTDSISSLSEYYSSEEFIRQAAKDRLGLVDSGEIVFRSEN